MSKHTPGPWEAMPGAYVWDIDGRVVAHVESWRENKQNLAHLIAAAPDLLAALKEMILTYYGDCAKTDEQARAAIAKAEGVS